MGREGGTGFASSVQPKRLSHTQYPIQIASIQHHAYCGLPELSYVILL